MNIFFVHEDPYIAAQCMVDRHTVKMVLETAQLLSTAHHVLDPEKLHEHIYKKTHANHPSAVWTRESSGNYFWLYHHLEGLLNEYTYRYAKLHKTSRLKEFLCIPPKNIRFGEFFPPPQAMPDEFKHENPVVAYRNYYKNGKKHLHRWTRREKPKWIDE